MSRPLHQGPVLPLAIMVMFALMIPMVSMVNRPQNVSDVSAKKVTVPTNEPVYMGDEVPFPSPTPTNSPKPRVNPSNRGSMSR